MPAKALGARAFARLMMGFGRQWRIFGWWVLAKGKGIPRKIRIEGHCVLVDCRGTYEVLIH